MNFSFLEMSEVKLTWAPGWSFDTITTDKTREEISNNKYCKTYTNNHSNKNITNVYLLAIYFSPQYIDNFRLNSHKFSKKEMQ